MFLSTILAALEAILCALNALKLLLERWEVEGLNRNLANKSSSITESDLEAGSDGEILDLYVMFPQFNALLSVETRALLAKFRPKPKYRYLGSWLCATLAFVSSIYPHGILFFSIPVYLVIATIISGIFGLMEGMIFIYIAAQRIIYSLEPKKLKVCRGRTFTTWTDCILDIFL